MESKTLLIGVTGKKQNGKDTIANYLHSRYKYNHLSFAGALKEGVKALFDFSEQQVNGDLKEVIDNRWGVSPRVVMQKFGTEIIREGAQKIVPNIGNNFWVKRLELDLQRMKGEKIVISDVRFPNEIQKIKELGGIVILVDRPSMNANCHDCHASENSINKEDADYVVINDSTMAELYKKIDEILLKF